MCLKTVDYSIIVNKNMTGPIIPGQVLKNILGTYEVTFGQAISLPKSKVYYNNRVEAALRESITNPLGVRAVTRKYLGLPSIMGRSKEATFGFIKDWIWHKINSWSSKYLSKAGREVLIKSTLQSIPSYFMIIYLHPNKFIDGIDKMINAFWWGHGGSMRKGMHRLSWKNWLLKFYGGMGFKTSFNVGMLGKQG